MELWIARDKDGELYLYPSKPRKGDYRFTCGYVYDESLGDEDNNVKAGTKFEDLGDDWVCPLCALGKEVFEAQ